MGSVNVYLYYYIYVKFSFETLFWAITVGNALGLLLSLAYFRWEKKLHYLTNTLALSFLLLALTDVAVYLGIKTSNVLPVYAGLLLFATSWLLLWNTNEYYVMKLEGLENRAKIVSNRLVIQNIVAMTVAFAYGYLVNNLTAVFLGSALLKFMVSAHYALFAKKVEIDDEDTITVRGVFFGFERKALFVASAFFITSTASMSFISSRSSIVYDLFGKEFIGTVVGSAFLLQMALSRPVTSWITRKGQLLLRSSVILAVLAVLFHHVSSDAITALTIIFASSLFTIVILAQRHAIFRFSHHEKTREIIAFGRYAGAIIRSTLSVFLFFGIMTPLKLYGVMSELLALSVIVTFAAWLFAERDVRGS